MDEPQQDRNREEGGESFVRERIVRRPGRNAWPFRLVLTGICGILFGLTAALTAAAVFPRASQWFVEESPQETLHINRDDTPDSTEGSEPSGEEPSGETPQETADGEIPGETEEPGTETETPLDEAAVRALIREMLAEGLEQYKPGAPAAQEIYRALASLGKIYNQAIVTVVMKNTGIDVFQNQVETSGECTGVLWNETDDGTLYILSSGTIPGDGTQIQVVFSDGSRRDATLCQADERTGFVVLRVSGSEVDMELRSRISVLGLGNSYSVRQGETVLVLGNVIGYSGAVVPATVTYTEGWFVCPDSAYRQIYLDCASEEGANGVAVSLSGEIIGIITPDTAGTITGALGVSDVKGVLELLSNQTKVPMLGIIGQTVTDELEERYGLPQGIYVTEAVAGSPAYAAGIQAGDVVCRVGEAEPASVRALRIAVEGLSTEQPVEVAVMRRGSDGYQELTFTLTPVFR